jgi:hypothetical protein
LQLRHHQIDELFETPGRVGGQQHEPVGSAVVDECFELIGHRGRCPDHLRHGEPERVDVGGLGDRDSLAGAGGHQRVLDALNAGHRNRVERSGRVELREVDTELTREHRQRRFRAQQRPQIRGLVAGLGL